MLIAARQIFTGKKSKDLEITKSMYSQGGTLEGFIINNLGTMPTSVTITCWYKITNFDNISLSKTIWKYGDKNNGVGFGKFKSYSPSYWYYPAGVVEGKVWIGFKKYNINPPTDLAWHHVAFTVKSSGQTFTNNTYIDGALASIEEGVDTNMNSPTNSFAICGKDNGLAWENPNVSAYACRVCIYDHIFTANEVIIDYAMKDKIPTNNLLHFWDGTVENNKLVDNVGNWNLTITQGSQIINETPWDKSP